MRTGRLTPSVMVSSWFGILVIAFILIVPGALLFLSGRRFFKEFDLLDTIVTVFLLSGIFNFLFFWVRLWPEVRLIFYLATVAVLATLVFRSLKRERFSLARYRMQWWVPLLVLVLGAVLVGYPFHALNLSRLSPNPEGGDVELFLHKTHLLHDGYSIFADPYAHEVNFYPVFLTSEVALATLLTGDGLALNAETFRIFMVVFIFWMIYALGRAVRLRDSEAVLLALFSLYGYSIWSHLVVYVMAGMAFFPTLMLLYLLARAIRTRDRSIWILAGLAGGLAVHSHLVHGIFAGLFTFVALAGVFVRDFIAQRKGLRKALFEPLKWFTMGTAPLIGVYLLPLIIKYRLDATSTWYLVEEFNQTYAAFFKGLSTNIPLLVAAGMTVAIWVLALIFRRRRSALLDEWLPLAHLYGGLFLLMILVRVFAIRIHHLAIYIDAGDFGTLILALSWLFIAKAAFTLFGRKPWTAWVRGGVTVLLVLLIFPLSPLHRFKPDFLWRYKAQIWDYTKLPAAEGERAREGNIPESAWDDFGRALNKAIPRSGAVLMNPDLTHTLGSHFARRVVVYSPAHSNVFIQPPFEERWFDHLRLFASPDSDRFYEMIKKYGITHVLWQVRDPVSIRKMLESAPFLKEIPLEHWLGIVYEVRPEFF